MKKAACTFKTFTQGDLVVALDWSDATGHATVGIGFTLQGSSLAFRLPVSGNLTMADMTGPLNATAANANHPATDFRAQTVEPNLHLGPFIRLSAVYLANHIGGPGVRIAILSTPNCPEPVSLSLQFDLSPESAAELAAVAYWTSKNI